MNVAAALTDGVDLESLIAGLQPANLDELALLATGKDGSLRDRAQAGTVRPASTERRPLLGDPLGMGRPRGGRRRGATRLPTRNRTTSDAVRRLAPDRLRNPPASRGRGFSGSVARPDRLPGHARHTRARRGGLGRLRRDPPGPAPQRFLGPVFRRDAPRLGRQPAVRGPTRTERGSGGLDTAHRSRYPHVPRLPRQHSGGCSHRDGRKAVIRLPRQVPLPAGRPVPTEAAAQ